MSDTVRRTRALDAAMGERGVLVRGDREVQLWARECALVAALLDRAPCPLSDSELSSLLWPVSVPSEAARGKSMTRLRRRLASVGLALRCRPRVGYTLEASAWVLELTSAPCRASAPKPPR